MTNRQYVQSNCARITLEVVYKEDDLLTRYEGISAVVGRVEDKVLQIDDLVERQERDQTGITENKETARHALIHTVLSVSGQILGLAESKGDADLRQRAADTQTEWLRIPQGKLGERAQSILELARTHEAELAKFGDIGELLPVLDGEIKAFAKELIKPREYITQRKSITRLIGQECRNLMNILRDELDPLMRQFEKTRPQVYLDYQNARALVDLPSVPRERRDAARQARADRKALIAQRRAERAAQAKQRKAGGTAAGQNVSLTS